MSCSEYTDLIALAAAGETTAEERRRVEAHIATCAACRKEHEQLSAIVADLNAPGDTVLSPIERLQLENQILRAAIERRAGKPQFLNLRVPLRTMLRIAATLIVFGLGYLTYPLISGPAVPAESASAPLSQYAEREQIRQALNSGLRFSGAGLKLIAHGRRAFQESHAEYPESR